MMNLSDLGKTIRRLRKESDYSQEALAQDAGKVVTHARQISLKVNEEFTELLQNIRYKAYKMSLE